MAAGGRGLAWLYYRNDKHTMTASFRQILVHVDASSQCAARLRVARELAGLHGSALTALYAVTPSLVELPVVPGVGPGLAAGLRAIDRARLAQAKSNFEREMSAPGGRAEWCEAQYAPVIGSFIQQAFYADLLVLGQHDRTDPDSRDVPADFVETVVVGSGKPALVLPYIARSGACDLAAPGTVVIAWKETPQSARAVEAAMPFLQRARHVHVTGWGPADRAAGGLSLESYLAAHQVSATWDFQQSEPENLGSLLLSAATDQQGDLLVMGCYGHSRAREWAFGGVTRTLLASMTMPVLMAH